MPDTPSAQRGSQSMSKRRWITVASLVAAVLLALLLWWAIAGSKASASDGAPESVLPQATSMGPVELITTDLAPMRAYYVDALGLEVISESATNVTLGRDGTEALRIAAAKDGQPDDPTEAGLYHSAFLYHDEASLAAAIVKVAGGAPNSFQGSSDHRVSLAFYFADPDGNGIELYVDRPADEWEWKDGEVTMGSAALDPNAFIQEHLQAGATTQPQIGHVHLRVGDLAQARAFYADTLGFAVTAESEGALFYAAGGYHHHVATNTWNSAGAQERSNAMGLGNFTVKLGSDAELDAAAARIEAAGLSFNSVGGVLVVDDPWGNTVRLLGS